MVIIDADVMIEVFRKNPDAINYLEKEIGVYAMVFSCITVTELQQGATSKENLQRINKILAPCIILPLQIEISHIFTALVNEFVLSHQTGIPDTLIAATALFYDLPLLTINQKHYKHIPNLKLLQHSIRPLKGNK